MKTSKTTSTTKPVGKKTDPVVHFEMPAEDRKRMAKFYTNEFGCHTKMPGGNMGNYILATTSAEVDKKGGPKKAGIINGGFYTKTDDMPAQYPSVVIAVQRWLLQLITLKNP